MKRLVLLAIAGLAALAIPAVAQAAPAAKQTTVNASVVGAC